MKNLDLKRLQELVKQFTDFSATFSLQKFNGEIDKEEQISKYQKNSDELIQIVRFVTNTTINKLRNE